MWEVEVRSKVPGAAQDTAPSVLVELERDRTTVRELIRRAVEEQLRELRADATRCRRTLDRQYLTRDEIERQAASGVVRSSAVPDAEREVTRAQRAYERHAFAVFAGGRQAGGLDEEIVLRLGEPVLFLRLTPLVGG
ncbi:hypothetical protein [Micromonospora pisi]|uniref:hypothetical protein n=1 Tax=Micromonospora pisi TaxID=589240 RepID=UPI0011C42996|nr:hypothetical protein [Micromonospora pisi]